MNKWTVLAGLAALIGGAWWWFSKKEPKRIDAIGQWIDSAQRASARFSVDRNLILAVVAVESGGNARAVGGAGELGLMQLKKIARQDVAENFGISFSDQEMFDGDKNIIVGTAFLSLTRRRVGDHLETWLGSYNQGAKGFQGAGRTEGLKYARKVIAKYEQFKTKGV